MTIFKNLIGMDFYYFLNCFFVYSFFGYIFECIVMTCQEKTPVINRGFIHGPLCTIYGVGALGAQFLLAPLTNSYLSLFIIGAIAATLLEIVTAKLMIKLFGYFWWDYNNKPFNYQGIICLESSICWGAMAVSIVVIFHPCVLKIVDLYYQPYGKFVAIFMCIAYCIDFSTSFYKAFGERKQYIEQDDESEFEDVIAEM